MVKAGISVAWVVCGLCVAGTAWAGSAEAPWRGVHIMAWGPAGGESLPTLKRAIAEVLAPMGVNVLVYEVDYNFGFEKRPDMRFGKVITKEEARDLAAHCRAHGIRLIPQFNCLGHQSWVRQNMIFPLLAWNPDMEEAPDLPYEQRTRTLKSWCPLHPGVNEIVFDLIDEIAEAFEADAFHVGLDEVLVIASPKCPRCAGKDPAELFAKAVNDLHGHIVGRRGMTMLMWGDRLLDAGGDNAGQGWEASNVGTAPAIDLIPKDIVICNWHYSVQKEYASVRIFQDKGFRILPSSWKSIEAAGALMDCAERHATERMLGHLCTSWVIESGHFALALLGEGDPAEMKDRAIPSVEALRYCMNRLRDAPAR